jgi:hypothetical protein
LVRHAVGPSITASCDFSNRARPAIFAPIDTKKLNSAPAATVADLECGEFSPLLAGDLSPSNRHAREFASSCWTRLCLADESARRKKRRQVARTPKSRLKILPPVGEISPLDSQIIVFT